MTVTDRHRALAHVWLLSQPTLIGELPSNKPYQQFIEPLAAFVASIEQDFGRAKWE